MKNPEICSIQIRYGGAKGVLCLNPDLDDNTIVLRKSQIKYDASYESLEILEVNKYRCGYLNRQTIILLSSLCIANGVFQDLQQEYLDSIKNCSLKDSSMYKHFTHYDGEMHQIRPIQNTLRRMTKYDINFENEPFLNGVIKTFKQRAYLGLRKKENILV